MSRILQVYTHDVEICDFDVDLDMLQEAEEIFLEPVPRDQIRDSDADIEQAKVSKKNVVNIQPESGSLSQNSPDGANDASNSENGMNRENMYVPQKIPYNHSDDCRYIDWNP